MVKSQLIDTLRSISPLEKNPILVLLKLFWILILVISGPTTRKCFHITLLIIMGLLLLDRNTIKTE